MGNSLSGELHPVGEGPGPTPPGPRCIEVLVVRWLLQEQKLVDRDTWPQVTQMCPPSDVSRSCTVEAAELARSEDLGQ